MDLEIENNNNSNLKSDDFSRTLKKHLETTFYSIDRFEENFAICENLSTGEFINIEKNLLPSDIKEGTILKYENNKYTIDFTKTIENQKEIESLVNNLFKKKK